MSRQEKTTEKEVEKRCSFVNFSEKMAKFEGSWKQVESHGLDEFLAASGIGWMKRKMATKCNPIDQIQISGENLTISYTGKVIFKKT